MSVTNLYFGWPGFLVLLAIIPVLAAAYFVLERRKKKYPLRYSSLALVRPALQQQSTLRRHLPAFLYLLALTSLLVTLAHPTALVNAPTRVKTVILALDVSDSMKNTDVAPTRLIAAERAALSFIQQSDQNVRIGIVAFSTQAVLIAPPTTDHGRLNSAIANMTTGDGTAIGSSIFIALKAIPEDAQAGKTSRSSAKTASNPAGKPDAPHADSPEIIILLTDGENNMGPEPLAAAGEAAARGVRVYTIGLALSYSSVMKNRSPGGQMIPDTGLGGLAMRESGEDTLKRISELTSGKYYPSENAAELGKIFAGLSGVQARSTDAQEISVVFIAFGAVTACAAMILGLLWRPL